MAKERKFQEKKRLNLRALSRESKNCLGIKLQDVWKTENKKDEKDGRFGSKIECLASQC